jgi:hypothetical protein
MAASVWSCLGSNIALDGSSDPYHRSTSVPAQRYMREVWGVGTDPQPLVLKFDRDYSPTPIFRLGQSFREQDSRPYATVNMLVEQHLLTLFIPYNKVMWDPFPPGATPTVTFTWAGEVPVVLSRYNYSFWRFITFRQPAGWRIEPAENRYSAQNYSMIDLPAEVHIAIPNTSEWQKLRELPA